MSTLTRKHITWKEHANQTVKKICRNIALLRGIRAYLPHQTRITFYKAYIQPHINYYNTLCGQSTHVPRIHILQWDFIPVIQPKFNTITYGHNTIRHQCSKIWNNLSNTLKMSNGLSSFKKSIQNGLDQGISVNIVCSALWHIYNVIVYIIFTFHSESYQ